jgi:hypothetical protein
MLRLTTVVSKGGSMRRHRAFRAGAALGFVLLAGTACAGKPAETKGPDVATLSSAAPAAPAASVAPSPGSQRPRERLDTTPEEYERMLKPMDQCTRDHGAKPKADWKPNQIPSRAEIAKLEAAIKVCEPLYMPLPPWEKDPANPDAKDFARETVQCLKDKGIKFVEVGDNGVDIELGGPQNDHDSIPKGLDEIPACEQAIAARTKK